MEQQRFNQRVCASSHLFPQMDEAMVLTMSMTTVVGSHCNYVSRCYYYGVTCNHPEHASGEGCMNLAYLEEVDPTWAEGIKEGRMTTVLSHVVRTEDPEGMHAIMAADNLKHGANLVEHSLQLVRRLVNYCLAEEAISSVVRHTSIVRRFLANTPMDASSVDFYFAFASRFGFSSVMSELEMFRSHYMSDGARDIEPAYYGKVASLPLNFPDLAGAVVKAQLTCPDFHMVKKVCKFINLGDIESLREGKNHHNKALACQEFLKQFREHYAHVLERICDASSTRILALLDSQAVRILLSKKCKFKSYAEVANQLHEDLSKVVSEEIEDKTSISLTKLYADAIDLRSSTRVSGSAIEQVSDVVKYDGNEVRKSFVCHERGIVVGAYLLCRGEVPDVNSSDILEVVGVDDEYVMMKIVGPDEKDLMVREMLMMMVFDLIMYC